MAVPDTVQSRSGDVLRFVTAGSVDDGKSTLIGRLLYETKAIAVDQLESLQRLGPASAEDSGPNLALVTDGLQAEREQGITIDVAFRYFSTSRRKFIIADSPGHEQYTRNMATGASTADLALVLVDAENGVTVQSRRHAFIASLLGIRHLLVAVNKMDLVDWSEERFQQIVADFQDFFARLDVHDVHFLPLSALKGDNVVSPSTNMPWYRGSALLPYLETVHIASDRNLIDLRLPVQRAHRPDSSFRGYMVRAASGVVRPGEEIMILPSGMRTRVREVLGPDGPIEAGFPPVPLTLTLEEELDISRGDMIVHVNNTPHVDRQCEAMIVWMSTEPMQCGRAYRAKHTTNMLGATVNRVRYKVDVRTLRRQPADALEVNEIGRCVLSWSRPVAFDAYSRNRATGGFILIDPVSQNTVAAGMILDREPDTLHVHGEATVQQQSSHVQEQAGQISADMRREAFGHGAGVVWLTGLPGSGKTTLAYTLEKRLFDLGVRTMVLDGENLRCGLGKDLGFEAGDRVENNRRAGEVARLACDAGLLSICALLSPYAEQRKKLRERIGAERFMEVYLSAPRDVCERRAPQGLYEQAQRGEIPMFTGVTAPYEPPCDADLVLPTHELDIEACVERILEMLHQRGVLQPN